MQQYCWRHPVNSRNFRVWHIVTIPWYRYDHSSYNSYRQTYTTWPFDFQAGVHARIQIYWCRSSIFRHLKLELLTQFPASNDEKYINVVYIWRKFVSFYGYVHWRMTTEISVMYGSEKVNMTKYDIEATPQSVTMQGTLLISTCCKVLLHCSWTVFSSSHLRIIHT